MLTSFEKRQYEHAHRHVNRREPDWPTELIHPRFLVTTAQALAEEAFHMDASLDHLLDVTYGPRPMVMRSIYTTMSSGFARTKEEAHMSHGSKGSKPSHIARPTNSRTKPKWPTRLTAMESAPAEHQRELVRVTLAPEADMQARIEDGFLVAMHEDDAAQGWLPSQTKARKLAPTA